MKRENKKTIGRDLKYEYKGLKQCITLTKMKGDTHAKCVSISTGVHFDIDLKLNFDRVESKVQKQIRQWFYNYLTENKLNNYHYILDLKMPTTKLAETKKQTIYVKLDAMMVNYHKDDIQAHVPFAQAITDIMLNELEKYR